MTTNLGTSVTLYLDILFMGIFLHYCEGKDVAVIRHSLVSKEEKVKFSLYSAPFRFLFCIFCCTLEVNNDMP